MVLRRWKLLAVLAGLGYILYCVFTAQPIFAHPLPQHTGPYAVGTIDIEVPAAPPHPIEPSLVFKGTSDPALELKTVLFSVYYPTTYAAAKSSKVKRHHWIPPPLWLRAKGYAKAAHISNRVTDAIFTGAIRMLVGSITIPAAVDAPLSDHASANVNFETSSETVHEAQRILNADPHDETKTTSAFSGHPVIVFSHGTVSSRTDYSHYAGELAARGYVVVMLEHRDGSGPGSEIIRIGHPKETRLLFDRSEIENIANVKHNEEISEADFHIAQLSFREAEIEEAVRVMKMINNGEGETLYRINSRGEGATLANWTGRLNTDDMIIAGHSYGATGALQALAGGPTDKKPFKGAIILDPGKSSGPLNTDIRVPMLVVHSNTWSSHTSLFYGGRAHFDTVKELVVQNNERGNPSWFMTSLGTSHPSVTDAPLLEPLLLSFTTGASIDVYQGLRQYVHVATDFLAFLKDGEAKGMLAEKAEFPQYDPGSGLGMWKPAQGDQDNEVKEVWEEEDKGEWWDWRSYWQVHVSPFGNKE